MSKVLNDAQRKLVEDNHNLIYSFLNSRHLSLDSVEDWYGTAAIGLCKAALTFDESRGAKFATLAYICMDNEVRQVLRKNRKNVTVVASLDDDIATAEGGCFLADVIPDSRDFYYPIYLNDAIEIASRSLNDRDKQIIDLIINHGLTHSAIAIKFGVAQPTVSRVYGKFLKKIREYFID